MQSELRPEVAYEPRYARYDFWMFDIAPDTGKCLGNVPPVQIEAYTEDHANSYLAPAFQLSRDHTQHLMDELWRVGVRPSRASTGSDVIDAQKAHLVDIREMAQGLSLTVADTTAALCEILKKRR